MDFWASVIVSRFSEKLEIQHIETLLKKTPPPKLQSKIHPMSQLKHTCGQLLVTAASGSPHLGTKLVSNQYWWTARENGAQVRSSFVMRAHLYENISPLQSSGGT